MKKLFEIFLLSLLVLLAACEEEVSGAFLPVPDANGYVTCSMELNGGVVAYEGATRSSNGYEWNDGDRLYIRFATDKDTVLGFANYNSIKDEWQVSYAGSLNAGVTQNCEVYFFENATHKDNTAVELTVLSAIYQDTAAVYRFESNTVSLSATLHPKTGRVRFVSQNRDEFSLAGIRYYIGFDLSNKEFDVNYRRRLVLNAHKQQDNGEYSTDYLYGFYEENYDGNVRKEVPLGLDIINHADTSRVYHKDFALEMLNAGNSGYITLPSKSTNQGWSVDKFNGGRYFAKWKYRGPDMSAAGGVLLNGNVIFDYDDSWYYCWGERDSDGDYLTDGKYYTGTGSISKTKYDLAYAWYNDFGGYMPAKTAVSQMLSLNKYSNFCLVSDDFNVLALGTTYGYEDLDSSEDYDVESKYLWTASAVNSTNAYAAVFTDNGYEIKSMHKKYGMGFLITFDKELQNNDNVHMKYTVSVSCEVGGSVAIKEHTETTFAFEEGSAATVVATPDEGANFLGWFVSGSDTPVSTAAEYTFTVSQDVALVARFEKDAYLPSGSIGGHYYVDLGLPSGVKWATCNVGASKPWEYGGIYAWGELNTKYYYEKNNSTTYSKDISDISGNPNYDVARADWGDSWRMPTKTECDELVSNCTWEKDTQNGVDGYKVTSNMNGKSIFLPAAGWRADAKSYEEGEKVNIWSSTPYSTTYVSSAYHIAVDPVCTGFSACYYGMSVRPVCGDAAPTPVAKYTISVGCDVGGNVAINGNSGTSATLETGVSVTVVATPDEGYAFSGWYVGGNALSTHAEYTFTVSEDVELLAKFTKIMNEINGHEYVDLGLPSGIKWATCNVGATTPAEYGGYYAWGETEEKTYYVSTTYNWKSEDVACVKWGSSWRMPTKVELDELHNECTWTKMTNGYKVTSKTNGNNIFLPAAGYRYGTEILSIGTANYWSSTLNANDDRFAYSLFYGSYFHIGYLNREYGYSVRPVCE